MWQVVFFESHNNHIPVHEYLESLDDKYRAKIIAYIELLRSKGGRLYEPYAKHVEGSMWELRIDLGRRASRVFYFLAHSQKIVLLHAFMKKTQKIPMREIETVRRYYEEYIHNQH